MIAQFQLISPLSKEVQYPHVPLEKSLRGAEKDLSKYFCLLPSYFLDEQGGGGGGGDSWQGHRDRGRFFGLNQAESGLYLQVNNNKSRVRPVHSKFKLRARQHMQVKHMGDLLRLLRCTDCAQPNPLYTDYDIIPWHHCTDPKHQRVLFFFFFIWIQIWTPILIPTLRHVTSYDLIRQ